MVLEATTSTFPPMDPSNESPQAMISPHMSESTIIVLLAFFCTVVSLAGLASVVPWDKIWRSCHDHVASRRANTGMKNESIEAIPSIIYGKSMLQLATECAICLAEFVEGEGVRVMPSCDHGFHMECVDKWLRSHSSCPTCRRCLLDPAGCTKVTNQTRSSKSEARETQIHQPREYQEEYGEIIDLECGVKK